LGEALHDGDFALEDFEALLSDEVFARMGQEAELFGEVEGEGTVYDALDLVSERGEEELALIDECGAGIGIVRFIGEAQGFGLKVIGGIFDEAKPRGVHLFRADAANKRLGQIAYTAEEAAIEEEDFKDLDGEEEGVVLQQERGITLV